MFYRSYYFGQHVDYNRSGLEEYSRGMGMHDCSWGVYGGGIVLPDLGVELPFQAGDVVFMRSWALWHFLKEYQGIEWYVIILSTSNALFNWSNRL